MKTATTTFIAALVVTLSLFISVPPASADQPLNVDCDHLAATLNAVDDYLDMKGVQFNSLGDIVSTAILDDEVFGLLSNLIYLASVANDGEAIVFESPSQTLSTIAQCGLIHDLIVNIGD